MSQQLILNFHGVGEPHAAVGEDERPFWVKRDQLKRILQRVAELRSGNSHSKHPEILITFDDGNKSDATLALPELTKWGLRATFFVCAGRVGKPHYLDKAALRDLLKAGMKVGNHGMHQLRLTSLSEAELQQEVGQGGATLSDIVGQGVEEMAIPFGAYNRRVLRWLQAQPLRTIYTSDRGFALSAARIKPRESITAQMAELSIPDVLLNPAALRTRMRRSFSGVYKRWL